MPKNNYKIERLNIQTPTVLTLEDLKLHCSIDPSNSYWDSWIQSAESAAWDYFEKNCETAIRLQDWRVDWPGFYSDQLELPVTPGTVLDTAIAPTLAYYDSTGSQINLVLNTDFGFSEGPDPFMYSMSGQWPTDTNTVLPWTVFAAWSAGYPATDIPESAKHAIRMLVAHWFLNRETVTPGAANDVPHAVTVMLDNFNSGNEFKTFGPGV